MGHLVVARAAETAIELAQENGIAWVGCRMSGHAGAAGVYAALPLKSDMVGIYSAVANANHMPLAGGAEPLLGTNPLAIAIFAGEEPPLVLDIATSIVSYGTIKNHKMQNRPLSMRGWGRSALTTLLAMLIGTFVIFLSGYLWLAMSIGPMKACTFAPASRIFCTGRQWWMARSWVASQSGFPQPMRSPAIAYMSLTTAVRPASVPVGAPRIGALMLCGTKAE